MGIYILVGVLYILLLGAFYIGFKEFSSLKENYNVNKILNSTKFQNLEDFAKDNSRESLKLYKQDIIKIITEHKECIKNNQEELESIKESYGKYIKDNQEELESIKKTYKEDEVIENYHRMLDLMDKFEKEQSSLNSYLSDSAYKLEKYPEKKHLELKRIINTNSSKLKGFKEQINILTNEINGLTKYVYEEVPNIKRKIPLTKNQRNY